MEVVCDDVDDADGLRPPLRLDVVASDATYKKLIAVSFACKIPNVLGVVVYFLEEYTGRPAGWYGIRGNCLRFGLLAICRSPPMATACLACRFSLHRVCGSALAANNGGHERAMLVTCCCIIVVLLSCPCLHSRRHTLFTKNTQGLDALEKYPGGGPSERIINVLFGLEPPFLVGSAPTVPPLQAPTAAVTRLNESQREAVAFALATRDVALIHGPPGEASVMVGSGHCHSRLFSVEGLPPRASTLRFGPPQVFSVMLPLRTIYASLRATCPG